MRNQSPVWTYFKRDFSEEDRNANAKGHELDVCILIGAADVVIGNRRPVQLARGQTKTTNNTLKLLLQSRALHWPLRIVTRVQSGPRRLGPVVGKDRSEHEEKNTRKWAQMIKKKKRGERKKAYRVWRK